MSKSSLGVLFVVGAFVFFGIFQGTRESAPTPKPSPEVVRTPVPQATNYIVDGVWPPQDDNSVLMEVDPVITNYYVIFDASGSMNENVSSGLSKLEAGKRALMTFANNLPEDANLGLLSFSPVNELLPLGRGNRSEFFSAVQSISAKGRTPLIESILSGYKVLTEQAKRQSGYGRYILVIVTDGASSDGNPAGVAMEVTRESPIEIQTIGFGVENHALNIPGVTQYVTARSPESLIEALNKVIASESEQFVDPARFVQ